MKAFALTQMLAAALAVGPALAASGPQVTYSADGLRVMIGATTHGVLPAGVNEPASTVIYSNLATKYKKGVYFSGEGYTLCGTDCLGVGQAWAATAFTPAASATANVVDTGIGYIAGTSSITVAILSDNNGAPGQTLGEAVIKKMPNAGTCCSLARAHFATGIQLKGGTQYWIAAMTDRKSQASTQAAWSMGEVDQVDTVLGAGDLGGGGWKVYQTNTPPAFAIYSK